MKNKGITLVALVITIIILLILAGITILQLTGNGLFVKTEQSTQKYKMAEAKEELNLLITNLKLETYSKNKRNSNLSDFKILINDKDNLILQEENYDSNNELTGVKVSYKDYIFLIDNNLNIVDNYNYDNGEEQDKDVVLEYSAKKANVQETVQALKLIDKTENEHNAELNNVYYNDNQKGIVFDGSSSYGTLDSSKLNISFPATVTVAAKWEDGAHNVFFIDIKSGIGIGTYENKLLLSAGGYKSYYYNLPEDFFEKEVNYITVLYNTNAADNELYVNGEKMTEIIDSGHHWNNSESGTYLGRRRAGNYFKGTLYDFKIYNKLFSEQEVMERYQKEKQNFENNTNNANEQDEYLVLDYVCNSQENEIKVTPNIIKNKLNSDYDIKLNNVEYNTNKNGLVFNGTSSYGTLNSNKLDITFPSTITTVVKWEEDDLNVLYIDTNSGMAIGSSGNQIVLSAMQKSYYYNLPEDFFENEVNYITVVYKESAVDNELYINGIRIEKTTTMGAWNWDENSTIYLGRRNRGDYFKGILYDFKIYNRMLSEDEIIRKYQQDKQYYGD